MAHLGQPIFWHADENDLAFEDVQCGLLVALPAAVEAECRLRLAQGTTDGN